MILKDVLLRKVRNQRNLHLAALALAVIMIIPASTPDCRAGNTTVTANNSSATACDASGNIWAVWHAGPVGSRDIYVGKLIPGWDTFGAGVRVTTNLADQLNPAISLGADDRLYVVWQDDRRGNWDIYGSTSANGTSWSVEQQIADSDNEQNYNQINPALAVDSQFPNHAYVVWQDDRAGNYDIYIAESSDAFATNTYTQVTSNTSNQTSPAIAVDVFNTVHVLWTDDRNTVNGTDIYGASGSSWINVPVVRKAANQSSPEVAVESSGSVLHMLWVDQASGNSDVYYASSAGLPGSPLAGNNIIDDTTNAEQLSPTIAVTGTGSEVQVFACWQDERNIFDGGGDLDLYMVEMNSSSGTNVFVGDGGANSDQTEPAIGIDWYGYPYVVWTDNRSTDPSIYYAGSTYMEPTPLVSGLVTAFSSDTIGTGDINDIRDVDDVSIAIPAGACPYDVTISVTRIVNAPDFNLPCLSGYDFGPSGLEFNLPVTITIPYAVSNTAGTPAAYWYDSHTGAASQQGIDNVEIIELSSSLHALRFTTTHLSPYYALFEAATDTGGDDGKGGGNKGGGKDKGDNPNKGKDNNNNGGRKNRDLNFASGLPDLCGSKEYGHFIEFVSVF